MSNKNEKPKPTRLLGSAPSSVYERLIVSYPNQTTSDFALFYQEAALRLADTYQGKPQDDMILHPFLYLYRQAVELQLKNTVSFLARTRMRYVDGKTDELQQLNDDAYLKRTYGHNMYRLLNEVKKQYASLQMEEPFPKSLENFISMFHEADSAGMAFRYAGLLPNVQENVDFPDLVQLLNEGYATLCRVGDDVDFTYSPSPTLDDLTDDYS